jgi:hypothetical protein
VGWGGPGVPLGLMALITSLGLGLGRVTAGGGGSVALVAILAEMQTLRGVQRSRIEVSLSGFGKLCKTLPNL